MGMMEAIQNSELHSGGLLAAHYHRKKRPSRYMRQHSVQA